MEGIFVHVPARGCEVELRVLPQRLHVLCRTMFYVRLNEELCPRLHEPAQLGPKGLCKDAPFVVSLLPPWVREMDRHAANRSARVGSLQDFPRISLQNGHVGEAVSAESLVDLVSELGLDLDPDDTALRRNLGALEKRQTAAKTDVQLDRTGTFEQPLERKAPLGGPRRSLAVEPA